MDGARILSKLDEMERHLDKIKEIAPDSLEEYEVELSQLDYGEYGETVLPFNPVEQGFTVDVNNRYFEPYSLATLPSTFIVNGDVRTPSGLQTYAFLKNLKLYVKGEGFTDGRCNFFFL